MAKEVITKYRPSLVLLFDDIPPLEWSGVNSHVMIYSHFPYAARLIFNIYDAMDSEYIDAFEILRERIFRIAFLHRYFYTGNIKDFENIKVTANSTITSLYIRKTWGVDSTILYPPIVSPQFIKQNIINNKQNIIVSLGVIMPGKRHGIVIDAFKKVKERLGNAKLIIIGSLVDKKYYDYLLKKIVSNRLKDSVFIFADIDEERKWAILSKAKVLVHAKRFEPFGITVAEAMMFGAIPIVYRGYTSGPWIDIVRKGEYGMGFRTIEELIEKIHYIMNLSKSEFEELQKKVLSRAHTFSINVFENSFIEIIEELLR
jgi:glycosyltransferase involved in cell wall biosynthesis